MITAFVKYDESIVSLSSPLPQAATFHSLSLKPIIASPFARVFVAADAGHAHTAIEAVTAVATMPAMIFLNFMLMSSINFVLRLHKY